jgi:hypothetical protein
MATIGVLIRNSTSKQIGNYRSEVQYDLGPRIEQRGHTVRYYNEQGTSGSDLSKRKVALGMLDDLKAGVIQGIAAYDFKRLTRDEFGVDGGKIARCIVEAHGQFHTWDREYNLRLDDDLMQFQFQCFIAGLDWRNIRNTLWSGTFKKLEREPHYMKTPLGYMNVADDRDRPFAAAVARANAGWCTGCATSCGTTSIPGGSASASIRASAQRSGINSRSMKTASRGILSSTFLSWGIGKRRGYANGGASSTSPRTRA